MRFQCPSCRGIVAVENTDLGIEVQCGHCGEIVRVPDSRVARGAVIGDFIIRREIGRGGMGVVYLSHQISLDRSAALKILSVKYAGDAQFVADFIREARAAAKLNHPYIVQAYAVGEDDGIFYFAMENIDGMTIKQVLQERESIPCDQALLIIQQIAEALNYAWHEQKLIHRDIKPDNIMLTASGRAKLADLGLAHIAGDLENTDADEVIGTPQYISPEHLTGSSMDVRSDIYSLGATFYHMVTGRFPYRGRNVSEIVHQHLDGTLIPPERINPQIPRSVSRIIQKMMQKNPQDRYQDASALADEIRTLRQSIPGASSIINLNAPACAIPDTSPISRARTPEPPRITSTRHKMRLTTAATRIHLNMAGTRTRQKGMTATNIRTRTGMTSTAGDSKFGFRTEIGLAYRRKRLLQKQKNPFFITFIILFGGLFLGGIIGAVAYSSHKKEKEEALQRAELKKSRLPAPKFLKELENICAFAKYNPKQQEEVLLKCEKFLVNHHPDDLSKHPEEQKKYKELIAYLQKAEQGLITENRAILSGRHEKNLQQKQKEQEEKIRREAEAKRKQEEAEAERAAKLAEAKRKAEEQKKLRETIQQNLAEWKKQAAKELTTFCGKSKSRNQMPQEVWSTWKAYMEKLATLAEETTDAETVKQIKAELESAQLFQKRLDNAKKIYNTLWNGGRLLEGTSVTIRKKHYTVTGIEKGRVTVRDKQSGVVISQNLFSDLSRYDRGNLLKIVVKKRKELANDLWLYFFLSGDLEKAGKAAKDDKDFLFLEEVSKK